ncbi:MAG: FKBP-type peptidyl-prolyl cis-trans isomerase [Bacteroidaceae bacterium]|nr:FKBP-type peptidyl-prolyl cis-trans isomerase [Bacteroidaceae bacterium]
MKKISYFAAVALAAVMASCNTNSTPTANIKSDVDSLCYSIGISQSEGLKDYLAMRMGVDTTYMNEFIQGLNDGANAGDDKKKQAYYAGLQIGQQVATQMIPGLNHQLFGEDSTKYIGQNNFMAGFVAGINNDTTIMTSEFAIEFTEKKFEEIKKAQIDEQYGSNKKAGEEFMAEIAKKEGVKQIENSGVYYEVITEGKGKIATDTSLVEVKYEGTLIDGTVFDGNMTSKDPITFRANQVIPGWTMALTHMPAGSKWKVYIPQDMAYGEREAGDKIKPYSTLIFVIDLISVDKK